MSHMSWIEVQFLKKALGTLGECREALKYTYAFAFYLVKNNECEIFESNQRDLEMATEALSGARRAACLCWWWGQAGPKRLCCGQTVPPTPRAHRPHVHQASLKATRATEALTHSSSRCSTSPSTATRAAGS